jgi:hypothetical protein
MSVRSDCRACCAKAEDAAETINPNSISPFTRHLVETIVPEQVPGPRSGFRRDEGWLHFQGPAQCVRPVRHLGRTLQKLASKGEGER